MDSHRKPSSSEVGDEGKSIITLNIQPLATVSSLNHFPLALAIGSFGGCMALLAAAVHCCCQPNTRSQFKNQIIQELQVYAEDRVDLDSYNQALSTQNIYEILTQNQSQQNKIQKINANWKNKHLECQTIEHKLKPLTKRCDATHVHQSSQIDELGKSMKEICLNYQKEIDKIKQFGKAFTKQQKAIDRIQTSKSEDKI